MNIIPMIIDAIYYLAMGYGVYVCWSAYKAQKKKAWLLISLFCLSPFFTLGLRAVTKAIYPKPPQNQQKTYITKKNGRRIVTKNQVVNVNLPIFQILLIVGISFLGEEEIKREISQNEKDSSDSASASPDDQ